MAENRMGVALNPGRGATPEEIGAFWFDGVVNTQGRVMNATNDMQLVESKRTNLSPEYYRRFHDITSWADRYPHGDPRTWVPLVYAGVKADDFMASEVMTADYDQQQIRGLTGRPKGAGKPSGSVTPEEASLAAEEEDSGWLNSIMGTGADAVGWVGEKITGEGEALGLGDIGVVGDLGRGAAGVVGDVANTAAVKGTVRNAFAAANMPAQAVTSSAANIQDDIRDGDWGMAVAHAYGANPVIEALFVGSENITGTDWYRKGGKEQTTWSQTDMGQVILDISGQGRGEQFGQYDDPMGLQSEQGSGFFIPESNATPGTAEGDVTSVGEWQRAARLNANTLVEEAAATPEQKRQIARIAKATSHEEAAKYAESVGLTLNAEDEWVQPALGFTFGRYTAGQFKDPRTEAYNNISGIVDFAGAIFTDPLTYVPGGQVKAGAAAIKGGARIADAQKGMVALAKTGEVIGDAKTVRNAVEEIDTFNTLLSDGVKLVREGEPIGGGADLKAALRQSFLGQRGDIQRMKDMGLRVVDEEGNDLGDVGTWAEAYDESATLAEMARGGSYANAKAWDWLSSGRGQSVVRGLAEEMDAFRIYRKSGGKINPQVADRLAKATTEDEVRTVLAPVLGIDIKRQNELNRFTTRLPAHSYDTRLAQAKDLRRLKEAWDAQGVRSLPGMERALGKTARERFNQAPGMAVMPGHEFDLDIVEDGLEQITKWATVYDRKILDDEGFSAAMSRYMATADKTSSRATRAAAFAAVYGKKGDDILVGPEGDILGTADEVADALLNPATRQDVLDKWEASGARLEQVKEDGIFGYLAERMAASEKRTIPLIGTKRSVRVDIAKQITQAFRSDLDQQRWYAQNGLGSNRQVPWADSNKSEPWLEGDVLQRGAMLPDARVMRQEISRLGRIYRAAEDGKLGRGNKQAEMVLRAGRVADDLSNQAVHYWKGLTLLAGGLRYPAYAMRQALDTTVAATLSGGPSVIHKPTDLLGLLFTSAVRGMEMNAKDRTLRKVAGIDNPLVNLLWRNQLVMDAEGEMFEDGLRKVMDGDASGHDLMYKALNISAGKRGSKGQDEWYSNSAPDWQRYDLDDDGSVYGYANSLATEVHRLTISPTARKLADENADMDQIVKWFMNAKGEGRDVVDKFGADLAATVKTEAGVREYLIEVRQQIRTMTGDDPEMLRMIATGKIDGEDIMKAGKGGDRAVNKKFIKYVEDARDSYKAGTRAHPLPPTLMGRKAMKGFDPSERNHWNNWTNTLFHSAGKWEDVMARDPFYRARYEEHILDNADMMMPDARKAMADDYRKTNPALAKKIDKITGEGPLTRKDINDLAERRSFNDVRDIAYDAANRRELAFSLRLMSPFVQAAANGMYRWSKAAIQNPESSYRFLRAANFLTGPDSAFISDFTESAGYAGDPFIFEDPETGQRMVSIPGSGIFLDQAAKAIGAIQGKPVEGIPESLQSGLAMPVGGLNLAFPQAEQAMLAQDTYGQGDLSTIAKTMWPGVGPAMTIPLDFAKDDWGFAEDFFFPYGRPEGGGTARISEILTPAAVRNISDGFWPSEQDKARRARLSVVTFGQILTEEGIDPTDPVAVDGAWERANAMTDTWRMVETAAQFGTPSGLNVEAVYKDPDLASDYAIGAEVLSGIFYEDYLSKPGVSYEDAQARFRREYGIGALALLTPSGDNSDVAPPTRAVSTLKRDYPAGYDKYGEVLNWLNIPNDEFDIDLFAKQVGSGERDVYTLDEKRDIILKKFQDTLYFQQTQNIDNASAPDDAKMMAKNELKATLEGKGWKGVLPSSNQQTRNVQVDLLVDMARDPKMRDFLNKRTADTIIAYSKARERTIGLMQSGASGDVMAGDLATTTSETWAPYRESLFAWGEQQANKNRDWAYIWYRSPLRAEVEPLIPEEEDY